jgi:hypothetical protein
MITHLDDYPVHQTPEPVAHPASGDPNVYDRYFFNGYTADGELFFAVAMGLYPNRRVMDAAVSVVRGGRQYVLRASRLAPLERTELSVGPITLEVVEPMTRLRVRVEDNEHGISADATFTARSAPLEEPRFSQRSPSGRLTMDLTRFAQFGSWSGQIAVAGERIDLDGLTVLGVRDRSWGVRGVGAPTPDIPSESQGRGQFYWLWAPLNFDDRCTHLGRNEYADGRTWHANAVVAPVLEAAGGPGGDPERMASSTASVEWEPGTRRAASAGLSFASTDGAQYEVTLEPLLHFQMIGIGYGHRTWGHGHWVDELAVSGESWALEEIEPMNPGNIHIQSLVRATLTEGGTTLEGTGVLEQLVIGPHEPSGFREALDPAR